MRASCHGHTFRITGPLLKGIHGTIHKFWCCLCFYAAAKETVESPVSWDAVTLIWRHCNVTHVNCCTLPIPSTPGVWVMSLREWFPQMALKDPNRLDLALKLSESPQRWRPCRLLNTTKRVVLKAWRISSEDGACKIYHTVRVIRWAPSRDMITA